MQAPTSSVLGRTIIAFAAFAFCAAAHGRTLVADVSNPAAADRNPGTIELPFRSLRTAALRAKPGDLVLVKPGIYREAVLVPSGKPGAPVRIEASGTEKPVVTGADIVTGPWKSHPSVPGLYSTRWARNAQMVIADGTLLRQVGPFYHLTPKGWKLPDTLLPGRETDLHPGDFFYDRQKKLLWLRLKSGDSPSAHRIEVSVRSSGFNLVAYTSIKGFEVRHFLADSRGHSAVAIHDGHDVEVEDCNIHHNDFSGLIPQGRAITVRGCELSFNGNNGMTSSFGSDIILDNNFTHHNNTRGYDMSWHGGGIKFVQQRRLTLHNHRAENEPIGVWLDINCLDALVDNSVFANCKIGLYYEISRWGVLANNVFTDCGLGLWSYSSDVLIAHNAFERCSQGIVVTGDARYAEYRLGHKDEPDLANNTLAAVRNNVIVNNLIVDSSQANIGIWPDTPSSAGQICDQNVFVRTTTTPEGTLAFPFRATWNQDLTLPEWQARGFDKHSLFCWPGAGTAAGFAEPPQLSFSGAAMSVSPAGHPLLTAGRAVGSALTRGETSQGRPWALTRGSTINRKAVFKFAGLWYNSWQRLPVQQEIAQINNGSPVPAGPISQWSRSADCPKFQ